MHPSSAARRTSLPGALLFALCAAGALGACDDSGTRGNGARSAVPARDPATTAAPVSTAGATTTASTTAEPAATTEPAATAEPTGQPAAAPTGAAVAATTPTASASATAKDWGCGEKGQKACPMQGWMKGVMAPALAGGDKDKIAKALSYIAAKPPPGMGSWSGMASEGAAAAAAGNIDGAKESCKKCHAAYQATYKATMRGNPW